MPRIDVDAMKGLTLISIDGMEKGSDEIVFKTSCGRTFRMFHDQDCCEDVSVEDVIGDHADLIGLPLVISEERSNMPEPDSNSYESCTWTFYEFATPKGSVTIRWLGVSNGYYSESVSFCEIEKSVFSRK